MYQSARRPQNTDFLENDLQVDCRRSIRNKWDDGCRSQEFQQQSTENSIKVRWGGTELLELLEAREAKGDIFFKIFENGPVPRLPVGTADVLIRSRIA